MKDLKWQKRAFSEWKKNDCKGTLMAPTGSGKTHVGLKAILDCKPKEKIMIVVPTIALLRQWRQEIWEKLNKIVVGQVGDGFHQESARIIVAVVNSVRNNIYKKDLLILDEIHEMGSLHNMQFILKGKFKRILGLSATPKREDKNRALSFAPIVFKYSRKKAIEDGVLNDFTVIFKKIELDVDERMEYELFQKYIKTQKYAVWKANSFLALPYRLKIAYIKRRKLLLNARNKIVEASNFIRDNSDERIVVFSEYIKTAEQLSKLLKKGSCVIYHSSMNGIDKQESIDKFSCGDVNTLITCRSLDRGLNVPDANIGIVVGSSKKYKQTTQRLGRILRKQKGKHSKLIVLYCADTTDLFTARKIERFISQDATKVIWE